MTQQKTHGRKKLFDGIGTKPATSPIVLGFIFILWVIGCLLFSFSLNNGQLIFLNIFLTIFAIFYFLLGFFLNMNQQLIFYEIYRLYGMSLMSITTLYVGVRHATFEESIIIIILYYISILISIIFLIGQPKKIMMKMKMARAGGWLKSRLDEKEWTWNPSYLDLDGPVEEQKRKKKLKILEKLHYVMPGIASIISFIFGNTQAIQIVGFVLIYLGINFVSEVGRISGIIQQLRIWEAEEGKKLMYPINKAKAENIPYKP